MIQPGHGETGPSNDVSVVIVSWNHRSCLPACLAALSAQDYLLIEIIVVDNASHDGSAEWVQEHAPYARLIRLEANQGFCRAFNLGARSASGVYILSLNPDVVARPGFISGLVHTAEADPRIGIVSPKLLRNDDPSRLDSTGLFLDRQRFPYDRGQMEVDDGRYDGNTEIFGVCGGAGFYRRSMLKDLADGHDEYLDEDFFAYYDDVDLAWRAKMRGWRSVFSPEAVAEHTRGWGDTLRKRPGQNGPGPRYALRNRYLMMVKNDSFGALLPALPSIMLRDAGRMLYMLLFRRDALAGIADLFRLLPGALKKRRAIQSRRTVQPKDLRYWFVKRGKPTG